MWQKYWQAKQQNSLDRIRNYSFPLGLCHARNSSPGVINRAISRLASSKDAS